MIAPGSETRLDNWRDTLGFGALFLRKIVRDESIALTWEVVWCLLCKIIRVFLSVPCWHDSLVQAVLRFKFSHERLLDVGTLAETSADRSHREHSRAFTALAPWAHARARAFIEVCRGCLDSTFRAIELYLHVQVRTHLSRRLSTGWSMQAREIFVLLIYRCLLPGHRLPT